jgi:hypothetical protein
VSVGMSERMMSGWTVSIAVVLAVILTVPLTLLLEVVANPLIKWGERRTKCPACGTASLKTVTWLKSNPPTRTGSYHICEQCGVRWFRHFGKTWIDASGPEFDGVFVGPAAGEEG